jgi:RNA polymerase sigma-70 factor (ECF subfamily)
MTEKGASPQIVRARDVTADADHEEFRAFFEAECAYVVNVLRRLGVAAADCPDVAHEVFMIALRHFAQCDKTRPLRPWVFGIAVRVARDWRRLARVRREVPGGESLDAREDDAPGPDELLHARRREAIVRSALDALDFDRRAVFVMHDIEGIAMPEIATALGIPLNTGYSRLRLARADFTAHVKRSRHAV